MDDESLKMVFNALDEVGTTSWQLQAQIIAELQDRGKYGDNVIPQIAKFLDVAPRRIYELAQIHTEILSEHPEFADMPLDKTHYTIALKSKKYGKDPVKMLEQAVDEGLSSNQLKKKIEFGDDILHTNYYELTKIPLHLETKKSYDSVTASMKTLSYISSRARIVEYKGRRMLELYEEG